MKLVPAINQIRKEWQRTIAQSTTARPFILFCTSVGSNRPAVTHDTLLAAALLVRSCRVETLLCDGTLPACEACTCYNIGVKSFLERGPQATHCKSCWQQGRSQFGDIGIPIHRYSDYLDENDQAYAQEIAKSLTSAELRTFVLDGVNVGEEAYAGALRFFAVGDLDEEPMGEAVLRRYLRGAVVTLRAIQRVFEQQRPDVVVFHHGIYVPQGIVGQVARQKSIRVVNLALGYRKQTFVYSHGDTYHRTMIDEPLTSWQDRALTAEERTQLFRYLDARKNSAQDWIVFNREPEERTRVIRERLSLDDRPLILLLTNVTWDAQLYYKNNGFPSLLDWLEYTIRYFSGRPDLQLVVRVHPAEIRGTMPTRQPVMAEIMKRMPALPSNVRVVHPEDDLSTYAVADMADCAVIFGTKTGVELVARGIPVIVVGEAWIRNKGLTIDVSSEQEYREILDRLPLGWRMPEEQVELAVRYAYHYFFRRLIPIQALAPVQRPQNLVTAALGKMGRVIDSWRVRGLVQSPYAVELDGISELRPGCDPGLDTVCNGIMTGSEFIFVPRSIHADQ